jgi:hypothetical protein
MHEDLIKTASNLIENISRIRLVNLPTPIFEFLSLRSTFIRLRRKPRALPVDECGLRG